MTINTKILLDDNKVIQCNSSVLTLSGDTQIASNGTLKYLTDQSQGAEFTLRSVPDVAYVTGKTSAIMSCISSNYYDKTQINYFTGTTLPTNYYNKTQINQYTGSTDNRINTIETKYISGATNGLTKQGQLVKLGGILTGSTIITDSRVIPVGIQYGGDYCANFTPRSLVDAAYVTGKTSTSGIQTANNGLTKVGTNVALGGILTGNTSLTGNYTLNICDGAKLNTTDGYQISGNTILKASTATISSLYMGNNAGNNGTGTDNFGVGYQVLQANTTGCTNIGIGYQVLQANTIGHNNIGIGYQALMSNIDGNGNIAMGNGTLVNNIHGKFNHAFGTGAMSCNISGCSNIAQGTGALQYNTVGCFNIALGHLALSCNVSGGSCNVAIGKNAMRRNKSGGENIAFGSCALFCNDNGNNNVTIGSYSGYLNITGSSSVFIGYCAGYNSNKSNRLYIANTNTCNLIYGEFDNNSVTLPTLKLCTTPSIGAINDSILVWNSTDKCVKTISGSQILASAITGATNGLTAASHIVCLGGALTTNTTISGANCLKLGDLDHICLSTQNTTDIALNAKSNGAIYLKSQSGTVTSSNDSTNAVLISIGYNASPAMLITDNTASPRGLVYAADYSNTFIDHSLVDKYYVDSIATGLNVHGSVTVATTEDITLSGLTIVDGISTTTGMRVLVKNQSSGQFNGIYSASTGIWGRTADYNFEPSGEVANGDLIPVLSGNTNANSQWILTTPNPITSGKTLTYSKFAQQQGMVAGDGICVTTVGANRQVDVKLSESTPGLCFDNTSLELNYNIFRYGLTCSQTSGNVDVKAAYCSAIGSEIPVALDTGNTSCKLYVDSCTIKTCLNPVINANNGLTKAGCTVSLGGALTGDTTINGNDGAYDLNISNLDSFNLGFNNISTITDSGTNGGLRYAADYSGNYVTRSLVDKGYVDGQITNNSVIACNGLTKAGNKIILGGTLTGNTTIDINNGNLLVTDGAGNFGADIATTYVQLGDINGVCGHLYVDDCGSFICMRNATGTTYGEFCFDSTAINGFVSDSIDTGSLNLTKSCYQIDVACGSNVIREQMLASLPEYIVYACGSNKQMFAGALKAPAMACCGAIYATSAGAGVSFGNGSITSIHSTALGNAKVAVGNVMVDVCGESINITTDCVGSTQYIDLDYPTNLITIESTCVNVGLGSTTNILIDGNVDSILVNTTGVQLCLQQSGGNIFTDTVNSKGLEYAEDYSINFTDRSLVDKAYVDGAVVSGTSLIYACNGLTKVDNTIALGGTLTGDTWICIPSDACFAFGDATTVNTNIQIIRTSGNESINMYTNGTTFWSDLYLHDDNSALRYYDCNAVTTSELVVEPNRAKMIVNDGNSEIDVDINYIQLGYYGTGNNEIYLDSAGISFLSDTAIILGDASYYNSQVFICAPITSGSTSDQVIVRDSSTGELKTVAGSSLGDKNNIYAMTVITTSTDLTTESTYVQIVNSPSASITVTLPATPIDGQVFRIKDGGNNAVNFPITIAPNGNLIDNAENNATLNTDGGALELVYNNELGSWFVFSFVN